MRRLLEDVLRSPNHEDGKGDGDDDDTTDKEARRMQAAGAPSIALKLDFS